MFKYNKSSDPHIQKYIENAEAVLNLLADSYPEDTEKLGPDIFNCLSMSVLFFIKKVINKDSRRETVQYLYHMLNQNIDIMEDQEKKLDKSVE